jgi:hypothetical protein
MGGRAHWRFSLVVAISSTDAMSEASLSPGNFLNFQTRACRLASYLAFPPPDTCTRHGVVLAPHERPRKDRRLLDRQSSEDLLTCPAPPPPPGRAWGGELRLVPAVPAPCQAPRAPASCKAGG